jgi:GNAT superfamily N-acetyltransferase
MYVERMQMKYELKKDGFELTTEPKRMQIETIHRFLQKSYWAPTRNQDVIERSIEGSLPFGIFVKGKQVAFARVVTDYATFAWICDVFVDEEYRGQGLSKWLMESMLKHPQLQGLRRWVLATKDAHSLYSKFGFTSLNKPERWMEIDNQPN